VSRRRISALLSAVGLVLMSTACQPESAEDPREGFTGDAALPVGGMGGGGPSGGIPSGGEIGQGGGGGASVPADACRFTFVYRAQAAADLGAP